MGLPFHHAPSSTSGDNDATTKWRTRPLICSMPVLNLTLLQIRTANNLFSRPYPFLGFLQSVVEQVVGMKSGDLAKTVVVLLVSFLVRVKVVSPIRTRAPHTRSRAQEFRSPGSSHRRRPQCRAVGGGGAQEKNQKKQTEGEES